MQSHSSTVGWRRYCLELDRWCASLSMVNVQYIIEIITLPAAINIKLYLIR